MSKSEFIRSRPHLSAKELVISGALNGYEIAPALVYVVRSNERRKQPKAKSVKACKACGRAM